MNCPKCKELLELIAEPSHSDSEKIEVRAECSKCMYWSYAFIDEKDFMVEESDHPINVLNEKAETSR